jgi:hypothetical protein
MAFASDLRAVSKLPLGDSAILKGWLFIVSNSSSAQSRVIAMPQRAWSVCASKFTEVATGREQSPFDFNDCGYLMPQLQQDIGVELIGAPMLDPKSPIHSI